MVCIIVWHSYIFHNYNDIYFSCVMFLFEISYSIVNFCFNMTSKLKSILHLYFFIANITNQSYFIVNGGNVG